jgi:glycosyltransferase involved in cell wall biosynthesis
MGDKMNICLFLLSDGWGGAETVVYELAKHLRDKGETVSIALNQEIIQYYTDLENIKIFSFGSFYPQKKTSDDLFFKAYSLLHSYLRELFRYRYYKGIQEEVMRFLSDNNIEVIHSHMPGAILLVSNLNDCKIPKIATCHGEHTLREKKTINLLRKPLIKWQARKFKRALDKTDKITFVSTYTLHKSRSSPERNCS